MSAIRSRHSVPPTPIPTPRPILSEVGSELEAGAWSPDSEAPISAGFTDEGPVDTVVEVFSVPADRDVVDEAVVDDTAVDESVVDGATIDVDVVEGSSEDMLK